MTLRLRALAPCLGLIALALGALGGLAAPARAARPAATLRLDVSAGAQVPLDGDSRDAWGMGQALHVGLSTRNSSSSWLGVEVGLIHTAGLETRFDPTFETRDTHFWLVPITLGVRWSAGHTPSGRTPLYLGLGAQTILTWYDPPDGPTRSNPALGFLAEWRYEIDMTDDAALFLRQRLLFTTEQTYAGAAPETGFSSTLLEVGLSRRLR